MRAQDLRVVTLFGRMNPYVVIECGQQKYKSEPDEYGHTEPKWTFTTCLPFSSTQDEIKIGCYDKGILMDQMIGETTMKIKEFQTSERSDLYIPIFSKTNDAGLIKIISRVELKSA